MVYYNNNEAFETINKARISYKQYSYNQLPCMLLNDIANSLCEVLVINMSVCYQPQEQNIA